MKHYNLSYDTCDIAENQFNFLKESGDYPNETEQELRNMAYNDTDVYSMVWRDFQECLTEYLNDIDKNKNSYFKIVGKNMGWRHLEGYKTLKALNGEELLNGILPKTDCSLWVWKGKRQIKIKCSHHDAPTGEYYFIKPLSKKEFKQETNNIY